MKRQIAIIAALIASPALAATGGELDTLPLGGYVCELPGDATGPVGIRAPEADFTIANASSYNTAAGSGAYLLTGDQVVMTSGPQRGTHYRRVYGGFLRKLDAGGSDSPLRCIRQVRNNNR